MGAPKLACESCSEHRRTVTKRGEVFTCARCHAAGNTGLIQRMHAIGAAKEGLKDAKSEDVATAWRLLNTAEELLEREVHRQVDRMNDELLEQRMRGERPWRKSA